METPAHQPLTKWRCDVCGEPIDDVKDGYVIWRGLAASGSPYGFKIIHQRVCDDKTYSHSAALKDYVGADGLAMLLSLLSIGPLKKAQGQSPMVVGDLDELVDFIRRTQTPYYEEARQRFSNEDVKQDLSDSNEVAPYMQANLQQLATGD